MNNCFAKLVLLKSEEGYNRNASKLAESYANLFEVFKSRFC